jgi:hypothetical protein
MGLPVLTGIYAEIELDQFTSASVEKVIDNIKKAHT